MAFRLESPSFKEGEMMDRRFSCDGDNLSPPLQWAETPDGTKSLALICDDPDAPGGSFIHWVAYNIPPIPPEIREGYPMVKTLPNGVCQGVSSYGSIGYSGPCPPSGIHHYHFKLYALRTVLDLGPGAGKSQVEKAMQNRILGQAQLVGTYTRSK